MKKITDLTDKEGREILEFVYPKKIEDNCYNTISFESKKDERGRHQVTMDMLPIIGIQYWNKMGDGCLIPFHDTRCVLWLYEHDYDIGDFLKYNKSFSQIENDFGNFAFCVEEIINKIDKNKEHPDSNFTLEKVSEKFKDLLEKYYYKDYE